MVRVTYENDIGKIVFGNENHKIITIDGLGVPHKLLTVVNYANESGQETVHTKDTARAITLSADVISKNQLQQDISRISRILYHPGVLRIQSGTKQRKINCRCTDFPDPERKGRDVARVVMQLTCDLPYFTDFTQKIVTIYKRENQIGATFTPPCVFTSRTNRVDVINTGDVKAEPIFTITAQGDSGIAQGIEIVNHTTKQHVKLDYATADGETITINIPDRSIISNKPTQNNNNGNLINYISQDTFLSNFWLHAGVNDIEAINHNDNTIHATCIYDNQYIEAVY